MSDELATTQKNVSVTVKSLLSKDVYKQRFNELLGTKAAGFISSIINVTQSDSKLMLANPSTIIASAVVAATLDLPVDKNLGFSWIIAYGKSAQFQMGYKGYIQLALRTGQYHRLNVVEVYENQFKSWNALTEELDADFTIDGSGNVVGYACYFILVTGFEKTTYWSVAKAKQHGKRFSKSFNSGPWATDFDEMAKKSILKNTLSKWGILSIEMQTAMKTDQAVIKDPSNINNIEYPDGFSDAEIVEEYEKDKSSEQVSGIMNQLDKVKAKKEAEQKAAEPKRMTFKTEEEARKFFVDDLGVVADLVKGDKLYSTGKEHGIEVLISGKLM